jgi:hypothetical protein
MQARRGPKLCQTLVPDLVCQLVAPVCRQRALRILNGRFQFPFLPVHSRIQRSDPSFERSVEPHGAFQVGARPLEFSKLLENTAQAEMSRGPCGTLGRNPVQQPCQLSRSGLVRERRPLVPGH